MQAVLMFAAAQSSAQLGAQASGLYFALHSDTPLGGFHYYAAASNNNGTSWGVAEDTGAEPLYIATDLYLLDNNGSPAVLITNQGGDDSLHYMYYTP